MTTSIPAAAASVRPLIFNVGRDRRGRWVVVEAHHVCGGLFSTEAAAIRYAREESGRRDQAIQIVDHLIEFEAA